jgi:hypothetical protein
MFLFLLRLSCCNCSHTSIATVTIPVLQIVPCCNHTFRTFLQPLTQTNLQSHVAILVANMSK